MNGSDKQLDRQIASMARRFGRFGQWPWRLVLLSLLTAGALGREVPAWFAPAAVTQNQSGPI